jgi:hypothetical protein
LPTGFRSVAPGSHRGVLPEHYGRWMDPFVVLAAAAAVTRRITLGTALCLPALRNALVLGKEVATLDVISGGRLVLGVGAGWIREECEAVGIPFVISSYDGWLPVAGDPDVLAADIATLRRLWAESGRDPESLLVTAMFAEPVQFATYDRLARLAEAGVQRVLLHERSSVIEMASGRGQTAEIVKRLSVVVERAASLK